MTPGTKEERTISMQSKTSLIKLENIDRIERIRTIETPSGQLLVDKTCLTKVVLAILVLS